MRWAALLVVLVGCREPTRAPSVIAISVTYAGASAEVVEREVVMPVEGAVASVKGVTALESRAENDHAIVAITLAAGAPIDRVMHDVHHALSEVGPTLPSGSDPPSISRSGDAPVVWLAVRGSLPIATSSTYARDVIAPRLERLQGVADVEPHGLAEPMLIVRPDLAKLAAAGVTLFDVLAAIRPVDDATLETFAEAVVAERAGAYVRLGDLATIEAGFERNSRGDAGEPTLEIRVQSGASRSTVAQRVRDELGKLELPLGMTLAETPGPAHPRPTFTASLFGADLDELRREANELVAELAAKGITNVTLDPAAGGPEPSIVPDRERAASLAIPIADIVATLRAIGHAPAGNVMLEGHHRDVVVRLPGKLDELVTLLRVRTTRGELVPLAEVVRLTVGPSVSILRRDRVRAIDLAITGPAIANQVVTDHALPVGYRVVVH